MCIGVFVWLFNIRSKISINFALLLEPCLAQKWMIPDYITEVGFCLKHKIMHTFLYICIVCTINWILFDERQKSYISLKVEKHWYIPISSGWRFIYTLRNVVRYSFKQGKHVFYYIILVASYLDQWLLEKYTWMDNLPLHDKLRKLNTFR